MNNPDTFDETRRVSVDAGGRPGPSGRKEPATRPRPTPSRRAAQKKRQQRIFNHHP